MMAMYRRILEESDENAKLSSVALKFAMKISAAHDIGKVEAVSILGGMPAWHSSAKFEIVGISSSLPAFSRQTLVLGSRSRVQSPIRTIESVLERVVDRRLDTALEIQCGIPSIDTFAVRLVRPLAGFRVLKDGKLQENKLDRFMSEARRLLAPQQTLYEFCTLKGVVPVFTGVTTWASWPLSEAYARYVLVVYSFGDWKEEEELKGEHATFAKELGDWYAATYEGGDGASGADDGGGRASDASDDGAVEGTGRKRSRPSFPLWEKDMIDAAFLKHLLKGRPRRRASAKLPGATKAARAPGAAPGEEAADSSEGDDDTEDEYAREAQQGEVEGIIAAMAGDGGTVFGGDDEEAMLKRLPDGGPDFDWTSVGGSWAWGARPEVTDDVTMEPELNLPKVDVYMAVWKQRIPIVHYILTEGKCRISIFGGGGAGKSHVAYCIMRLARREARSSAAAKSVAATGAAALQIGGCTIQSTFPSCPPFGPNRCKPQTVLADKRLGVDSLERICATMRPLNVLVIDETSMIDSVMYAFIHFRCCEASSALKGAAGLEVELDQQPFADVPCVVQMGDCAQRGPETMILRSEKRKNGALNPSRGGGCTFRVTGPQASSDEWRSRLRVQVARREGPHADRRRRVAGVPADARGRGLRCRHARSEYATRSFGTRAASRDDGAPQRHDDQRAHGDVQQPRA
jgi:hypothetical protein